MKTPNLRHRITLRARTATRPNDGELVYTWADWLANEPADFKFLSGREFIAAQANQSQVIAQCVIRWRPGVLSSMALVFDGATYNIVSVLPDESSRWWLTIMLAGGVSEDGE